MAALINTKPPSSISQKPRPRLKHDEPRAWFLTDLEYAVVIHVHTYTDRVIVGLSYLWIELFINKFESALKKPDVFEEAGI